MVQTGHKPKSRQLYTLLLSVAVLSAPAGWGWQLKQRPEVPLVRVPQLAGQNLGTVQVILNGSRLRLGRVIRVASGQPPDTVLQQRPEAGTAVPAGSLIEVAVAAPPAQPRLRMPNLIGMDVSHVRTVLSELNLARVRVTEAASDRPPGTVIQQRPPAGEIVKPGTEITVTIAAQRVSRPTPEAGPPGVSEHQPPVSQPPRPITRPPADPQAQPPDLRQRPPFLRPLPPFLRPQPEGPQPQPIGPQAEPASPPPEPLPQEQPPEPQRPVLQAYVPQQPVAQPATQAQTVKPVVPQLSVAPPRIRVMVPQLIGSDADKAEASLVNSGLRLGSVGQTPGTPPGIIVQQEPAAGTLVAPGTVVGIIISSGAMKIPVPGIIGFERSRATRVLDDLGLRLVVSEERASGQAAGTVLQQQPPAGTLVEKGAAVVVTVAARLVRVPDLIGRTMDEANAALSNVDLRLGHVEDRLFGLKSGVVQQHPEPGTGVTAGTPVSIMIVEPLGAYAIWFGGGFAALGAGWLTMRRYLKARMPHLRVRPDPAGSAEAHPAPMVLWPAEVRVRLVIDPGEQSTSLEGL